jgi:ABC-type transport system involved in multi-copper enzyme maturation permease subunit
MSSGAVGSLPRLAHTGRVTQARVVLSELTKLRSVRSTRWSLGVAVLLTIGLPSLFAVVTSSHWGSMGPQERADRHPLEIALAGVDLSQLAIGVLGVLAITGEYSTGMIRATMTAVPRRLPVLWGKAVVFGAVTFALMLPSVLAAYLASQAILSRHHLLQTSLSAPGVLRAVVGGALYLTVVGAFTLGLGAILRNTAGATAAFAGIMFVIPPLLVVLPSSWNDAISPYLPSSAGRAVFSLTHGSDSLAPWPGFAIFCGYAAATLAVAAVLLRRRDT